MKLFLIALLLILFTGCNTSNPHEHNQQIRQLFPDGGYTIYRPNDPTYVSRILVFENGTTVIVNWNAFNNARVVGFRLQTPRYEEVTRRRYAKTPR